MHAIELLSPAANIEIGKEAILHGADAVYIGAPSHGARKSASNSISDIANLCEFAHQFHAKIYVTVNTLVYDNEIDQVESLCWQLYHAGVDALIIQDMALLRMNLPPIALHASTQCDTRTVAKAKFLQDVGMSQIVLARELNINEIKDICREVSVPIECFVHGALCVSYSGRCHASCALKNRSANRGECAQICRLPYTLTDSEGKIIVENKHLLSLKDFNLSGNIEDLILAGVRSFKIEGRLKDALYVKNVTAYYRNVIDKIVAKYPEKYCRSSFGKSEISFEPNLSKSFNRGFTRYFLESRYNSESMASIFTPKSLGEPINSLSKLNNGDGISWIDKTGNYTGCIVNKVERGKIISFSKNKPCKNDKIFRTNDIAWQKQLNRPTSERRIDVDITLYDNRLYAIDERGIECGVEIKLPEEKAIKPQNPESTLAKLGGSIYKLRRFANNMQTNRLIPNSILADARRRLVDLLNQTNSSIYHYDKRRKENIDALYPSVKLDFRDNVSNKLAQQFYRQHGVEEIQRAMEVEMPIKRASDQTLVMNTRYCVLRQLGLCLKQSGDDCCKLKLPLTLTSGNITMKLVPDCKNCENLIYTSNATIDKNEQKH